MALLPLASISQTYTATSKIEPDWRNNSLPEAFEGKITTDSIYYFPKKGKNKDSMLLAVLSFDKTGRLINQQDFNLNRFLVKHTAFIRRDGMIIEKAVQTYSPPSTSREEYKSVTTYTYDEAKNLIEEKTDISYAPDFSNPITTIIAAQYDGNGNKIKETTILPSGKKFTSASYTYQNGKLVETEKYDDSEQFAYASRYSYPAANTVRVRVKSDRDEYLYSESVYDDKKNLLKNKKFDVVLPDRRYYIQEIYEYDSEGLLQQQTFINILNEKHYFRHYYGADELLRN